MLEDEADKAEMRKVDDVQEPSRKREDLLKQTANSRKFKKDSIIFGIPVKNNSRNINTSLQPSQITQQQSKKGNQSFLDCLIIDPE